MLHPTVTLDVGSLCKQSLIQQYFQPCHVICLPLSFHGKGFIFLFHKTVWSQSHLRIRKLLSLLYNKISF